MSLNALYGPCLAHARPVNDQEKAYKPESLSELNDETGPALREYMQGVLKLPRIAHSAMTLLWIVTEDGTIRFALEELFSDDEMKLIAIRPRASFAALPNTFKLGHPSLLDDPNKFARIGGEIVYNFDETRWEINNFSGRYGSRPHTKKAHLEAVAGKFAEYDISLEVDFDQP